MNLLADERKAGSKNSESNLCKVQPSKVHEEICPSREILHAIGLSLLEGKMNLSKK